MKDDKIAVVEDQAERVQLIYRRYLELGGVYALGRDLWERGAGFSNQIKTARDGC